MKRIFAFCIMIWCLEAQQDAKITYLATQASVQDVVRTMAAQAGLGYNWQKSFDQTNPLCRRWVRDVRIEAVPFGTAMQRILDPVGLRYEIENGSVVLSRAPNAIQPGDTLLGFIDSLGIPLSRAPNAIRPGDTELSAAQSRAGKSISYLAERKSVQYIVIDLAAQVGLGYNWKKSFAQTDPECRQFMFNVSIKEQPFQKAMAKILDPVGLRYEVESGEVVLYRR